MSLWYTLASGAQQTTSQIFVPYTPGHILQIVANPQTVTWAVGGAQMFQVARSLCKQGTQRLYLAYQTKGSPLTVGVTEDLQLIWASARVSSVCIYTAGGTPGGTGATGATGPTGPTGAGPTGPTGPPIEILYPLVNPSFTGSQVVSQSLTL